MDLRATFGFHSTPFTREIRTEEQMHLPLFDDALSGLRATVQKRMSAALIAPSGTGKTALLRRLVSELPEARYQVRYIKVTGVSKGELCREIAAVLGLAPAGNYPSLLRRLQEHYENVRSNDALCSVLILDESHDLRPDVLGMLRILTNFHMDSELVLSLVLAGQSPLRSLLRRDDQEAIARRIADYATLRPLSRQESRDYLEHRCTLAGATTYPFDNSASEALFEISRGNLRALDNLALRALEITAAANLQAVSSTDVIEARRRLWP